MGVLPYLDLPLADKSTPWDVQEANRQVCKWASSDGSGDKAKIDFAKYQWAFLWVDDSAPEKFGSYKFQYCSIGAGHLVVVPRAIFAAAGVLQGARGGTTIPEVDIPAMKTHIVAYYAKIAAEQGGESKAPWNRSAFDDAERRVITAGELRALVPEGQKHPILDGYAAVFNTLSDDLGGFREIIKPGAFSDVIGGDVVALLDHQPQYVLGRTASGTLKLDVDARGLHVVIDPPGTTWANDLLVSMDRGDIRQMSFGFKVAQGGDSWNRSNDGVVTRTVTKYSRLFDVSIVTIPAYPATEVAIRSLQAFLGEQAQTEQQYQEAEAQERIKSLRNRLRLAELQ